MKDVNDPTWQSEGETAWYRKIEDDLSCTKRFPADETASHHCTLETGHEGMCHPVADTCDHENQIRELDAEANKLALQLTNLCDERDSLEAELARVRGLLQRASEALKAAKSRMPDRDSLPVRTATEAGRVLNVVDDSISELDSCLQGAESADMGKLDTAENKAGNLRKLGSAETGGEKESENCTKCFHLRAHHDPQYGCTIYEDPADDQSLCDCSTFRCSSQNQTVSGGVDGVHEGTTADEKGESREPEKLNNEHKSQIQERNEHQYDLQAAEDALAESSISSPPPTLQELMRQSWEGPGTVLEPDKVRENLGLKQKATKGDL